LKVPLITSNRINMPDVAEAVLARGDADIVSMARPMLADPDLVRNPDGHPNSPTYGHPKFPHPDLGVRLV
jgi:2,4-dienoyl-CoA reductase-like NADH-dependent reductase (Old Yellow Enzyme family)